MFFIISFAILHFIIHRKTINRKNKIKLSLCDIQDIVYFQSRIGTSTDIILASSSKLAKEPLKTPLEKASSLYKITRDLEKSLEPLFEFSSLVELRAFLFTLLQKEQTGSSEENHKAQAIMMKRNKRLRKKIGREVKRSKLILASILLFSCYVLMIVIPIFKETFSSVTKILN